MMGRNLGPREVRGAERPAGGAAVEGEEGCPEPVSIRKDGLAGAAGRRGGCPGPRSGAPSPLAPGHDRGAARRPGRRPPAAPAGPGAAGLRPTASTSYSGSSAAAAARWSGRQSASSVGRALRAPAPRARRPARDARVLGELWECAARVGPARLRGRGLPRLLPAPQLDVLHAHDEPLFVQNAERHESGRGAGPRADGALRASSFYEG